VQARRPEQETSSSEPSTSGGLGWVDQLVPFQSSIRGVPWNELPTAKQTLGCGHEMPFSDPKLLRVVICQLVPSQRSATGRKLRGFSDPSSTTPTAMHEFADEQSTPDRLFAGPEMVGVGVTVHAADAAEGANSSAAIATRR
jgi:hypothetical protein